MIAQRDTALEIVEDDETQECENENYHTGSSENQNQEVGISIGEESVTQKYFNGNRAVKLTKLNVAKKKKSPLMNANKPLKKVYSKIIIVSLITVVAVLSMLFFYLAQSDANIEN